jgi:hypothetical protein
VRAAKADLLGYPANGKLFPCGLFACLRGVIAKLPPAIFSPTAGLLAGGGDAEVGERVGAARIEAEASLRTGIPTRAAVLVIVEKGGAYPSAFGLSARAATNARDTREMRGASVATSAAVGVGAA